MNRAFSTPVPNIVLIGMAGAGKSTVGRALAGLSGRPFLDTDQLIEKHGGRPLQELLETLGADQFRRLEEQVLLGIDRTGHVIATGGSAIYSSAGMTHLQRSGYLVLLDARPEALLERISDLGQRGLVNPGQQDFPTLYHERAPLYAKWADIRIDTSLAPPDALARRILQQLDLSSNQHGWTKIAGHNEP